MNAKKLISAGCLVAYAATLAGTGLLKPEFPRTVAASIVELRSRTALVAALWSLLFWLLREVLRFVPLGVLVTFVLPVNEERRGRVALTVALGFVTLAAQAIFTGANPLAMPLPMLGVCLGSWAGQVYRRGTQARIAFVLHLAGALVVVLVGVLGLCALALESAPLRLDSPPITSEDRLQLLHALRGKDPRKIPQRQTRALRLSAPELDRLVAWGAWVGLKARTSVSLRDGGASGLVALPIPHTSLWLNLSASSGLRLEQGRFYFDDPHLRVGRLRVPTLLLGWVAESVLDSLRRGRDSGAVLGAVKSLSLTPAAAVVTYGSIDMPPGLAARLLWGEEESDGIRAAVRDHVERLLQVLQASPTGDARFGLALRAAFAAAGERSKGHSAVAENRVALLALGIVLGHSQLFRVLGGRLDHQVLATIEGVRSGTTLRGRGDWVRHFAVSCALTVLSAVAPSDAVGMLKEELDADGGSGFSFADLLADRCGTTLAELATRDESSALEMQGRAAQGIALQDFFPPPEGLPEGIPKAELQSRYGGVGGPLFQTISDDIERRIRSCSAYRVAGAQGAY